MRARGRKTADADRPSLVGLCPRVKDSRVTPQFWMEEAWLTCEI